MSLEDFVRRLPKVELHCHLLGSMRAETCAEFVRRENLTLPAPVETIYANMFSRGRDDPRYAKTRISMAPDPDIVAPPVCYSLLDVARWVAPALTRPEDFARVVFEAVETAHQSGARYMEMFFEPTLFFANGLDYPRIADGVSEGARRAERDLGVRCRMIAGINRSEPPVHATEMVRMMIANPREEIIGIGLEDYELNGPPENFVEAYRLAKANGLHRTAHASEHDPTARHVATCLDVLGCERIDHGYFILEDDAVVARCRDQGVYFTCLSTTSRRAWRAWRRRSIQAMVKAGLRVVLASDDPGMFPNTLNNEYLIAVRQLGFDARQMRAIALNGIEASWMNEADKRAMRASFTREIDALEKECLGSA